MVIKTIFPSHAREFVKNYRTPIAVTVIFIGTVITLFIGRLYERSALTQILAVRNSSGQDYATLFSKDKAEEFQRRDVSADDNAGTQASINNSATGNNSTSNTGNASSSTPVNNPPVSNNPAPAVFTVSISDFRQDQSPALQCTGGSVGGISLGKCSKTYSFAASVQAQNGPGSVAYNWLYSVSGSSNGTFSAGNGSSLTVLHNTVTLSCKDPGIFTAAFSVSSPNAARSQSLQINHSCN